jgi:hypothetical protein
MLRSLVQNFVPGDTGIFVVTSYLKASAVCIPLLQRPRSLILQTPFFRINVFSIVHDNTIIMLLPSFLSQQ